MDSGLYSNILVVRLGSMGDILHMLPAVATLKRGFPRARITWVVEAHWSVLLRGNPHIDCVFPLEMNLWRRQWRKPESWNRLRLACRELRAARFDLAIDFQGLIKSALLARLARPGSLIGFDAGLLREGAAALLYARRVKSESRHMVDQNIDLALAAGASRPVVEFPIPACEPEGALPEGDFVLASPIAGWTAKQWPASYYAHLAGLLQRRLGWPLVINCAPGQQEIAGEIMSQAPRGSCVQNVSSVAGLIGATRLARAVIGSDSGPTHLAALMGKPGVALYGPTDPARNGPYGSGFAVLRARNAQTTHERAKVISASMRALDPERVFQALETQLAQHSVLESQR
jgi:heptosyltransferase-1